MIRRGSALRPAHRVVSLDTRHTLTRLSSSSHTSRRSKHTICNASDPYTVLGVAPDADQNTINRAYTKKKYDARDKPALVREIEAAHSQLMLSSLKARLKGDVRVSKDILYADREPLFPGRPKRWDATPNIMMIIGVVQLGLVAFGFQQPQFGNVLASMAVGVVGNVMKQNAINPPPKDPDYATEEEAGRGGSNFVRGAVLGLAATAVGILLTSWPEYVMPYVQNKLPIPANISLPKLLVAFKILGVALCNWIMTSFYY